MSRLHPTFRWFLAGGAVICAVITYMGAPLTHRSSASVHETRVVDCPITLRQLLAGRRDFDVRRWRELMGRADQYLHLGTDQIEWSMQAFKGGYLYFYGVGNRGWEFAPCDAKSLDGLNATDTHIRFFGANDPNGVEAFKGRWKTNCIVVQEGDVVLARLADNTNRVFALHLAAQNGEQLLVNFKHLAIDPAKDGR